MRILYHYPLCGPSRVVRFILSEKKLDFDLKYENPWSPSSDLYDNNIAGTLPVLVDISGSAIFGSSAIREYLEEVYPDNNLLGIDYSQRAEARRIADWFDFIFYKEVYFPIINEKIMKRFAKTSEERSVNPNSIRLATSKLNNHLDYIDWLIDRRNWIAGKDFSAADIYAASYISVMDYLSIVQWDKHEMTKGWYARIKSRPGFRSILKDNLSQIPPSKDYANLDF